MTGLAVTKRWGLSLSPVVWRGRGGLGCDGAVGERVAAPAGAVVYYNVRPVAFATG
jgi:hypothetical protein